MPHEKVVVVECLQPKLEIVARLLAYFAYHVQETHIAVNGENGGLQPRQIFVALVEHVHCVGGLQLSALVFSFLLSLS